VPQLVRETTIPKDTLYAWRAKARKEARGVAAHPSPRGGLSSEEKFAVVVETAALNEVELGAYCRARGLYPQEVDAWRASCLQANSVRSPKAERAESRAQQQQIKALERELRRKEQALAEAAALLVLKKKARALWGEPEDGISSWRNDKP
jgi:hypothetical protein